MIDLMIIFACVLIAFLVALYAFFIVDILKAPTPLKNAKKRAKKGKK